MIFNLFSETDASKHAKEKRPIAKYYSKVAVAGLEPHVDAMILKLCQSLDSRSAEDGTGLDLGRWLLFCTSKLDTFIQSPMFPVSMPV